MFRSLKPLEEEGDNYPLPPKKKSGANLPIEMTLLLEKVQPVLDACLLSGHYVLFAGVLNGNELQIKGVGDNFPDELLPQLSKKLEEAIQESLPASNEKAPPDISQEGHLSKHV